MPKKKRYRSNGAYRERTRLKRTLARAYRAAKLAAMGIPTTVPTNPFGNDHTYCALQNNVEKRATNVSRDRLLGEQGRRLQQPRRKPPAICGEGGQNLDSLENVFDLSKVKCEPEDLVDEMMEEESLPENPSVDSVQVKMEPQDDEEEEFVAEVTQEEDENPLCGVRAELVVPDYESIPSSYGRGRYSRRNCQHYRCKFGECRKTFATEHEIRVHMSEHTDDVRISYVCEFAGCGARFVVRTTAEKHVKTHFGTLKVNKCAVQPQTRRKRFMCDFDGCGRVFSSEVYAMVHHAYLHDCDTPYLCELRGCKLRFASREERDQHVATHQDRQAFICTFEGCGLSFSSGSCLQIHCKTVHTGKKPFRCSLSACGIRVSTKFLLEVHTKTHSLLRSFVCTYEGCDKRYKQAASLDAHLVIHNSAKCTFPGCGERFRDKEAVEKHVTIHTGEKPFPCTLDGCGERFGSYWGMLAHKRTHSAALQKTKCGYDGCEEMVRNTFRRKHFLHHHGTVTMYQCAVEGCGATFDLKSRYEVHVRHCEPKINFVCEFEGCSEGFREESQFMEHYRNHTNVESEPS